MTGSNGLDGLRVVTFESRRAMEMGRLIERYGGSAILAPTLREVPMTAGPELERLAKALSLRELDAMVFLTGVGTRALVDAISPLLPRDELIALLRPLTLVTRGPKSVVALKELGLTPNVMAPAPHTWLELLVEFRRAVDLRDCRVAIQEYGVPHAVLSDALLRAGAAVMSVPVYRWALPEDTRPLQAAMDSLVERAVDVALFTSGPQIDQLVAFVESRGMADRALQGLRNCAVGSVGPSCTERLVACGVPPDFTPEHSKMGHLVQCAAKVAPKLLQAKR